MRVTLNEWRVPSNKALGSFWHNYLSKPTLRQAHWNKGDLNLIKIRSSLTFQKRKLNLLFRESWKNVAFFHRRRRRRRRRRQSRT